MKIVRLLEKGDIITDDTLVWWRGRWVKSDFVGKPVVRGLFIIETEQKVDAITYKEALQDLYDCVKKGAFVSLRGAMNYAKAILRR